MLENKKDKEEENPYEISDESAAKIENMVKIAAIIGVFVFLLVAGASMKGEVKKPIGNAGLTGDTVISYFGKIGSNYSLDVTEEINGSKHVIKYITDGTFDLYSVDDSKDGYLIYKNKTYMINTDTFDIKEYNNSLDLLNDKYLSIKLIKNVISACEMEIISSSSATCKLGFGDFITKYNEMYETSIEYSGEDTLTMNIKFDTLINNVEVDYSTINNLINGSSDTVKYSYRLHNYNLNNFSSFYEIYSGTIVKEEN